MSAPCKVNDVISVSTLAGGRRTRWLVLEVFGRRGRMPSEPYALRLTDFVTKTADPGKGDITRYASQLVDLKGTGPVVLGHYVPAEPRTPGGGPRTPGRYVPAD